MTPTFPEPLRDTAAQIAAVADPRNPKGAAFFARGTPVPQVPGHLHSVTRPEGTLVTNNQAKARAFQSAPVLHDALMARLLDYPESKAAVAASGAPAVVQGITPSGAVAHEAAASPAGLLAALQQARSVVPGGSARVVTPGAAVGRRVAGLLGL